MTLYWRKWDRLIEFIEEIMTYWKPGEVRVDSRGTPINPGDVLECIEPGWPKYHICYIDPFDMDVVYVRDLDCNNVGMCDLGIDGNVINLGHYTKNPGILDQNDIDWYFSTKRG